MFRKLSQLFGRGPNTQKTRKNTPLQEFKANLTDRELNHLRQKLLAELRAYEKARKWSWRSFCLFADKTRPEHIANLREKIIYMKTTEEMEKFKAFIKTDEMTYAISKNSVYYKASLASMEEMIRKARLKI